MLFRHCETNDISIDEGSSWINRGELDEIVAIIQALLRPDQPHGPVQPSEISVIAPFREQVWRARTMLRSLGLDAVDVGTVEALQGGEKCVGRILSALIGSRIVILSVVRSRARFVRDDLAKSLGLLHQPRRFNVATTRAKELMIVRASHVVAKADHPGCRQCSAARVRCPLARPARFLHAQSFVRDARLRRADDADTKARPYPSSTTARRSRSRRSKSRCAPTRRSIPMPTRRCSPDPCCGLFCAIRHVCRSIHRPAAGTAGKSPRDLRATRPSRVLPSPPRLVCFHTHSLDRPTSRRRRPSSRCARFASRSLAPCSACSACSRSSAPSQTRRRVVGALIPAPRLRPPLSPRRRSPRRAACFGRSRAPCERVATLAARTGSCRSSGKCPCRHARTSLIGPARSGRPR